MGRFREKASGRGSGECHKQGVLVFLFHDSGFVVQEYFYISGSLFCNSFFVTPFLCFRALAALEVKVFASSVR